MLGFWFPKDHKCWGIILKQKISLKKRTGKIRNVNSITQGTCSLTQNWSCFDVAFCLFDKSKVQYRYLQSIGALEKQKHQHDSNASMKQISSYMYG